ncbi:tetraacyldisaccharide 4'-kinase [Candidatus Protochlamydia naegleriophila]|uniref:Tetraacyldisaccharide 4'-kinase n=1 Tax=Candidatus Protochlamydia naegleriophila TaxID=389348 RepID=A0A0U5JDY3_9BACT|nr:tetraacyldisaccharide 4'-kinase [Candidatus Protochlamydia naegleriophila]CUI17726.1 tetraacyldisaccharide 4'-kinase [Candidatus Protochlamydia naegleriophila]
MLVKKFEVYVKEVIKGQKRGGVPTLIKWMLLPLSWAYRLIVVVRNWLYDQGWMRRYVPPVSLVMSVGNIVAGGTGKTPVTLLIANAFYERFDLAILSRGYRSKAEKLDNPIVLCEGQGPIFPASYCGDEPYIYAQRFPKAIVVVGGNRKKASFLAAKAGAQIILLDDAMQHRRLARDFDIVVIDGGDPFGQGYFLPRGFLREDIRSLNRANLLILNHITDSEQFKNVKNQLKHYTTAPMIGVKGVVCHRRDLKGREIENLQGQRVGMFCAIAHPEYFKRTLESEGVIVVAESCLPDHDEIKEKDLENFAQQCKQLGAQWLICTEKDRVKLPDQLVLSLPIAWIQIELAVIEGEEEWKAFLAKAEAKIS